MFKFFKLLDFLIEKTSLYVLISSIVVMLILTLMIIVLRWMNISYLWVDPLVRHLVFLSAFLGGVLATGRKNHIAIDVFSRLLEAKGFKNLDHNIKRFVDLVSAGVLLWMTKASFDFVTMEKEYGTEIFLGLHSGTVVMIIPIGFILIAYRFFYNFISSFDKGESV